MDRSGDDMNAIDIAVGEYLKTIHDLLARIGNMAIENAGIKAELVAARKEIEQLKAEREKPKDA